jgi:hypothetical protein
MRGVTEQTESFSSTTGNKQKCNSTNKIFKNIDITGYGSIGL